MFSFGFDSDANEKNGASEDTRSNENDNDNGKEFALEILAKDIASKKPKALREIAIEDITLKLVDITQVDISNTDAETADGLNSDLVPGVYEGGLKVWECSIDLAQYLLREFKEKTFKKERVLEVGCGAAIPGLVAQQLGAHVDFQDYNAEVIHHVTSVNVQLNERDGDIIDFTATLTNPVVDNSYTPRYFVGDWGALKVLMDGTDCTYDYILTSETVYSTTSCVSLYALIHARLKKPHGKAYVAAKTYYFGVGGGTLEFMGLVETKGQMRAKHVFKYEDGVNREIIELSWV